jgi:hypothetical protein
LELLYEMHSVFLGGTIGALLFFATVN